MTNRVVIVTGGFGALGRAVSQAFAAAGDTIARIDYAPAPAEIIGSLDIGGRDIADPFEAEAVIRQVASALGEPSILVNVAGGFVWEPLETAGASSYERMFRVNALTAANMARAALPMLRRRSAATIINVGAGAALHAAGGMGAYAASKSAVHRLTESLAIELVGSSVTVNAVLPSIIDTPANRSDMPDADPKAWVSPAALADVMLFLASPAARAISGALLPVTRGGV